MTRSPSTQTGSNNLVLGEHRVVQLLWRRDRRRRQHRLGTVRGRLRHLQHRPRRARTTRKSKSAAASSTPPRACRRRRSARRLRKFRLGRRRIRPRRGTKLRHGHQQRFAPRRARPHGQRQLRHLPGHRPDTLPLSERRPAPAGRPKALPTRGVLRAVNRVRMTRLLAALARQGPPLADRPARRSSRLLGSARNPGASRRSEAHRPSGLLPTLFSGRAEGCLETSENSNPGSPEYVIWRPTPPRATGGDGRVLATGARKRSQSQRLRTNPRLPYGPIQTGRTPTWRLQAFSPLPSRR